MISYPSTYTSYSYLLTTLRYASSFPAFIWISLLWVAFPALPACSDPASFSWITITFSKSHRSHHWNKYGITCHVFSSYASHSLTHLLLILRPIPLLPFYYVTPHPHSTVVV